MSTKTASVIYVEIYAEEKEAGDDPLDEIERELAEEEAGVGPEEEEKEDGLGLAWFGISPTATIMRAREAQPARQCLGSRSRHS